ncbi:hypothetical protein BGX27_001885 [Mortierella sp. AM989]|nr:hypothetical protein BGX27_001885 [Mortierella sp. AM989]
MSKLFASSPYSQATYSPLRSSKDPNQDDDDPESTISGHNTTNNSNNHKQFRSRSYSQSSSRSALTMSDHRQSQQHQNNAQAVTFAEGEDDIDEKAIQFGRRISTASVRSVATTTSKGAPTSPTSRRSSANRIGITPSTSIMVDSTATLESCNDKLTLAPPKYVAEDLEYSEPSSQDEESGLGYDEDGKGDGLLMQASTTLVFAVIGLICAGWLLDVMQHWQVFVDISELIILIPILLNLKGNLEMNLASRLSTAANMGLLDQRESRNAFIKGNLALLQVQSLTVGSVAGLFSFGLGVVVHPTTNNFGEIALMITASMICAAMSSFVLGSFMCGLVLVCRRYRINPDTPYPVILLVILLALIPVWIIYVRKNKFVSEVLKEGWVPVFAAMVIASTAGLTLERYINEFPDMALISPVLNGLVAMARWITHMFWKWGYDPDNYVLPILTSLIDVIGTGLLVAGFWLLRAGNMA